MIRTLRDPNFVLVEIEELKKQLATLEEFQKTFLENDGSHNDELLKMRQLAFREGFNSGWQSAGGFFHRELIMRGYVNE